MTNPTPSVQLLIKDLHRLGYAGRGDVVLGEGHRWRQREQRRTHRLHSTTSSLTNHMEPVREMSCVPRRRSNAAHRA